MVAMFENFVSVTQEEDVPQVRRRSCHFVLLHLSERIHELNLSTINPVMDISSYKYDYTS